MTGDLGNKQIMATNIRRLLDASGRTQTEMCHDLKFKASTVSGWLHADTYPRIDKIEKMANYFGVQKSDLVERYADNTTNKESMQLTDEEIALITAYRQLNQEGQEKAKEYVEDLLSSSKYIKSDLDKVVEKAE